MIWRNERLLTKGVAMTNPGDRGNTSIQVTVLSDGNIDMHHLSGSSAA